MDERCIVEAAKADPAAFEALYRHYLRSVYRYVYAYTRDHAEAEDLTSEIFLRVLRGIGTYHERGTPFSAWLFAIARNVVADRYRHRQVHCPIEAVADSLPDGGTSPWHRLQQQEEIAAVAQAVAQLPATQREVLVLKFFGQQSHREIAAILGRSEPAVKMLLHRAVTTLRTHCQKAANP